jgi:pentatricopeptide repeat protein
MKRKGVWPNFINFAVLLDTCANAREPYKAFELFSEIKYWDLEPNFVTYTALIALALRLAGQSGQRLYCGKCGRAALNQMKSPTAL